VPGMLRFSLRIAVLSCNNASNLHPNYPPCRNKIPWPYVRLPIAECLYSRFDRGFSPLRLVPVIYELDTQVHLLKPIADAARVLVQTTKSPASFAKAMLSAHVEAFLEHAITFKHEGFADELEILPPAFAHGVDDENCCDRRWEGSHFQRF